MSTRSTLGVWFILGVFLLVAGCDTSVQSVVPSDQYHYSIFGVLNPAQDTQWVRVEPLNEQTSAGVSSALDASVTLKHEETGQEWSLQDSLMQVEGESHHNFWTTAPISPSTTYHLTVRGPQGEVTEASTTTPARAPSIDVRDPIRLPCLSFAEANQFRVVVTEIEELAGLKMRYFQSVFGPATVHEFDHYGDVSKQGDSYSAVVNYGEDLQRAQRTMERQCLVDSAEVVAVSGGPDWPDWASYHDASISQLARPDSFSNVRGGHGMLAGVYSETKSVPIEERDLQ